MGQMQSTFAATGPESHCESFPFRVPSFLVLMNRNRREAVSNLMELEHSVGLLKTDVSNRAPWSEMTQRFRDHASYCATERRKIRDSQENHETRLSGFLLTQNQILERLVKMEQAQQETDRRLTDLYTATDKIQKDISELRNQTSEIIAVEELTSMNHSVLQEKLESFQYQTDLDLKRLDSQTSFLQNKIERVESDTSVTQNPRIEDFQGSCEDQLAIVRREVAEVQNDVSGLALQSTKDVETNKDVANSQLLELTGALKTVDANVWQLEATINGKLAAIVDDLFNLHKHLKFLQASHSESLQSSKAEMEENRCNLGSLAREVTKLKNASAQKDSVSLHELDRQLAEDVTAVDRRMQASQLQKVEDNLKACFDFEFMEMDSELDTDP